MSAAARPSPPGTATLADLLSLPEEERYEMIDGELVPKEAASGKHGSAQVSLGHLLFPYRRRGGPPDQPGGWWFASEALIDLGPQQKYRPDVAGWRRERLAAPPTEVPITLRPDWICEILSATNASNDTIRKMQGYHVAQVPHYWLLDPRDETLTVYRWQAEGYLRVLGAERTDTVRAEPFGAVELKVGALFDDEE